MVVSNPFITETPVRAFLRRQLERLNRVIAESDRDWEVAMARRYAAKVRHYLFNETDMALDILQGDFGQNGWGAAVDDICRHTERAATLDGEPIDRATADELRSLAPAQKVAA